MMYTLHNAASSVSRRLRACEHQTRKGAVGAGENCHLAVTQLAFEWCSLCDIPRV